MKSMKNCSKLGIYPQFCMGKKTLRRIVLRQGYHRLYNLSKISIIAIPTVFVLISMQISNWSVFEFAGIKGSDFKDYQTILTYKECLKESGLFKLPLYSSDCWTGFNYGPTAIFLVGLLEFLFGSTFVVGWVTIILIALSLFYVSAVYGSSDVSGRLFQSILIISPGILLLFERGNLDSWVFLFLLLVVCNYRRLNPWIIFLTLVSITLIKFYTLLASIYLILRLPILNFYKTIMIMFITFATLVFFVPVAGLIPYNWFLSFGTFMPFIYLDFVSPSIQFNSLSFVLKIFLGLVFLSLFTLILYKGSLKFRETVSFNQLQESSFSMVGDVFSICFLSSYILSTSYDYRLIFLLPALLILERDLFLDHLRNKNRLSFMVLSLTSLYMGSIYIAPFGIFQTLQLLGDLGLTLISGILGLRLIYRYKALNRKGLGHLRHLFIA
jgi:hypothetical protein